jgi:hypothetical protein
MLFRLAGYASCIGNNSIKYSLYISFVVMRSIRDENFHCVSAQAHKVRGISGPEPTVCDADIKVTKISQVFLTKKLISN